MMDPRILIVARSRKRPGSTWFGESFIDAKSGREIDINDLRIANVIAEVRPAGFYFIWKDRGGRGGRLRLGIPRRFTDSITSDARGTLLGLDEVRS